MFHSKISLGRGNGKLHIGRGKKNLKPDIVVKNYWRNNEQFADFFNAVLFEGRQLIKPDELENMDTEESSVLEHREYAESIGASRDNIKIRKKSTRYDVAFVILGMEGQERIHYAMPMRVMGYDYGTYRKQYEDNASRYRNAKNLTEDEFVSRMKKTDKLIPVITIVVYYGEREWDGAIALHGMLNIPEEKKPFVNDYKMHLVEARKNSLRLHNINNQDLFNLLEILLDRNGKLHEIREKAINYAREHEVEKTVIMTVAGAANCKMDYNMNEKEGDADMCTVFEETWREGKVEGKAEGEAAGKVYGRAQEIVETGHEFELSEADILTRLQKKLNISLQRAQEYLAVFGKQTV